MSAIKRWNRRVRASVWLTLVLLRELLRSSWSVAAAALARQPRTAPAVLEVPLRLRSRQGLATLANLVTLTPGTTSLHISADRRTLYVHCLDGSDPASVVAGIQRDFEDVLMEIET